MEHRSLPPPLDTLFSVTNGVGESDEYFDIWWTTRDTSPAWSREKFWVSKVEYIQSGTYDGLTLSPGEHRLVIASYRDHDWHYKLLPSTEAVRAAFAQFLLLGYVSDDTIPASTPIIHPLT